MSSPVDQLLNALETGGRIPEGCYAPDAVFDATTPGWRFAITGAPEIADWYQHFHGVPARFAHVRREAIPTGECVEYTLEWDGPGGTHAVHHCHLLDLQDGAIAKDMMFCGGQWGPERLAEMAAG